MSIYILNDLSMEKFYNDYESFREAYRDITLFYRIGKEYEHIIYINTKAIADTRICNIPLRNAINNTKEISKELKSLIITIVDKSSPSLPADSAIPDGFEFFFDKTKIPHTGLAECAYRQMMEETVSAYSLPSQKYNFGTLKISITQNNNAISDEIIKNLFSLESFKEEVQLMKSINSWDDLIDFIDNNYEYIVMTDDAKKYLKRETFEVRLSDVIIIRISALNKMITAKSSKIFSEMYKNYCGKKRAWFSVESVTRIRKLKEKLTFLIHGKNILCSYHAKIEQRDFRIHFSSHPKIGEKIYIAYIGGKIL
jgi:hypothetical protein